MRKLFERFVLLVVVATCFIASGIRLDYAPAVAYEMYNGKAGSKYLFSDTAVIVSPNGTAIGSANPLSSTSRMSGTVSTLLNATSSVAAGTAVQSTATRKTFQAKLNGASAVSATVLAEGSLDGSSFVTLCTLSLTASVKSVACAQDNVYPYIRGNLTAISGVGAYSATLLEAE